ALIRIETPSSLATARLGDSSTLRVGDEVAAIGNPIGLEQTMTRGIVSGLNRILPGLAEQPMIQTDAPINPGNSGGPLVARCPADRAGGRGGTTSVVVQGEEYLLGGDVLTAIQGAPIRTHAEYLAKVRTLKAGQRVKVTIVRDGQSRELTLTVTERPRLPADLVE